MATKIAWCEESWNPITGCTKVSPGCQNCYAEAMTRRFWRAWGCEPPPNHFRVKFHPDRLDQPLRWKKPRRIFVCSMSDLFHEDINAEQIRAVLSAAVVRPQHTFIVLTKRAERMEQFWRQDWALNMPANIWMGVTAENQKYLDERVAILRDIPAAVRWISWEPALAATDFTGRLDGISWVVAGAESGTNRRPCKLQWMVDVVEQCKAAGVPVFVKQVPLPNNYPSQFPHGPITAIGDLDDAQEDNGWRVSHDPAEWPEPLRVREWPRETP